MQGKRNTSMNSRKKKYFYELKEKEGKRENVVLKLQSVELWLKESPIFFIFQKEVKYFYLFMSIILIYHLCN